MILHEKLEKNADGGDHLVNEIASELSDAQDQFIFRDKPDKDQILDYIDYGIYLCRTEQANFSTIGGILGKVRSCL